MDHTSDKGVIIIGTGAQVKYAIEIFHHLGICLVGVIYLGEKPKNDIVYEDKLLGSLDQFDEIYMDHEKPMLLLACSKNEVKEQIVNDLNRFNPIYASAIHPDAVIASTAKLGQGLIINPRAVIQPYAMVGNHCMIHAGVIVEHDCVVENFVNIAPNATITGHGRIGRGANVFSGAVLLPSVKIGDYANIGAGAVVLNDVPERQTVIGVPARIIT